MRFVTPEIFLIAKSVPQDDEIRNWLLHIGCDPEVAERYAIGGDKRNGERIVELAGRRCYLAFQPEKLNPNVTRIRESIIEYCDNILKSKHGSVCEHVYFTFAIEGVSRVMTAELNRHRVGAAMCLSGDTLIYHHAARSKKTGHIERKLRKTSLKNLYEMCQTPYGRSRIPLVRIRVLDELTGEFVQGKIKRVIKSGKKQLFTVSVSGGYSVKMSADHRVLTDKGWMTLKDICGGMLYFNDKTGITVRENSNVQIAVNGCSIPATVAITESGKVLYRDRQWLEDEIKAGKTFREMGSIAGVSKHTIRASVHKNGLSNLSVRINKFRRSPWNKGLRYTLPKRGEWYRELCRQVCRRGPSHPMWRGGITSHPMSPVLRMQILERDCYRCKLCKKAPTRRKLYVHHIDIFVYGKESNTDPRNLITLCASCHGKVTGREAQFAPKLSELLDEIPHTHTGVSSKRVSTRLRVAFKDIVDVRYCGNEETYDLEMDGENHNFVANGIVVHNSEGSMRYIRFNDIPFTQTPLLTITDEDKTDPDYLEYVNASSDDNIVHLKSIAVKKQKTRDLFEISTRYDEYIYDQFCQIWSEELKPDSKFRDKKHVTSLGRRIIPMGVATGGVWTYNIRSLRHICEMRASEAAEEEIFVVAVKILQKMIEQEPSLLGDFEQNTDGFYAPKYSKI